jgi:predicted aspartyl protease
MRSLLVILALVIAVGSSILGCAHPDPKLRRFADRYRAPAKIEFYGEEVVIPVKRGSQGHLFVEAEIGDAIHMLLVDTGAPRFELDPFLIKRHQLSVRSIEMEVKDSDEKHWQVGILPELSLSSAQVLETSVLFNNWRETPLGRDFAASTGRTVDGALGGPLLEKLRMQIDYRDNQAIMGNSKVPDATWTVRLIKRDMGRIYVKIHIADTAYWVLVDTGASNTTLDASLMARHGFRLAGSQAHALWGNRERTTLIGAVPSLRIGPVTVTESLIHFADLSGTFDETERRHAGRPVLGFLGGDLLSALGACIDYGRGRLYLRRPEQAQ